MNASEHREDALIGRVLGDKFRLRSRVGAGSSGTVYQADQTALGRTVAVKVLKPQMARDPRLVRRFHDEALAASRLNHPNTVSVIDYGQSADGLLYIVMEYLRGMSLTELIHGEGVLPDARIVDLLSQVLAGLEEAHHAGVIHADLKPDNIVVERRRGGWDLVKVVDFGIARLLEAPPSKTSKRSICGTPEYMAPEIISGQAPTVTTDLYAVGVMLYEILAGQTPFGGGGAIDVLTRHLNDDPVLPSVKEPLRGIHPVLEAVAMRALAKNPAQRFASAVAFRDALAQALEEADGDAPGITCPGCSVKSAAHFKFCPECGYPLSDGMIMELMSEVATEPHAMVVDASERLPAAAERDTQEDLRESAPGHSLWPLPLLGREEAMAAGLAFLAGEDTGVLALAGAGGSGRARLARALCEHAASAGAQVFRQGPDPTGLRAPLHPIRAVVARILALPPSCAYDSLSASLEALGLSRRDLPGIAELFGHHGELWQLEPEVRQRELSAATVRVLKAATRRGRLVLCFENVDRYDRPSQLILTRLAEVQDERPLRVIVTVSPALAGAWPASSARIELGPLGPDELAALAAHLEEAGLEHLPGAAQLAAHTDGTPGHVHHLVRFVVEGGSVDRAPRAIADLVAERVKALPHPARVLCQAAAVFGDEVSRAVLGDALGSRLEPDELDAALSAIRARGLCHEEGDVIGFDSRLVREVVYDATPAELRRELHAAAAAALEPRMTCPLVLGHHHAMAGTLARAAALLERAGDDAVHQLDEAGATRIYHRALDAARALMLGDDDSAARTRFVSLSVKLAEALRLGGQAALARGIIEEARGYSDGNPLLDAQLLQASAHVSLGEGKLDAAIATLRRGIGLLIQAGDTGLLAEMYLDLSSLHMRRGDVAQTLAELAEGLDLVTLGEGPDAADGPEILWRLLLRLSQLHAAVEQHERALVVAESALIHARRVRSRIGSARVQAVLATLYERAGNLALAEQYRDAAVGELRRLGDRRGTSELLLSGLTPTRTLLRVSPASLREAWELADEVGWSEGAALAQEKIKTN